MCIFFISPSHLSYSHHDINAFIRVPVHVVRTSRRLIFRLLAWNPWQAVFLRGFDHLRAPVSLSFAVERCVRLRIIA